ncbi:RNA 2'-phosphotransferase [Ramlibacter terrae]|uniref:Probable RNA 2'-phosphotransferase n=1 Tax=Ramlibacter terrae TaxID=2732511 RepID=A0ABX6P6X8_9BURK|nr:RNA 2'-phosphotransferase [Ramlibacter terrae]
MSRSSGSPDQLAGVSRLLSKVLRHEPELIGVRLDAQGWADIDNLLLAIGRAASSPLAGKRLRGLPAVNRQFLQQVVAENDEGRFAVSSDGTRIRAVQGHSVRVDLGYAHEQPPKVLFHGTAAASLPSIERQGLVPGSRHAVHLSSARDAARAVGARHGRPVVLTVLAGRMQQDGLAFAQATNGGWLTESVPPKYLKRPR